MDPGDRPLRRLGFTLIELLVVLTIIVIVSVIALPTVVSSWNHRQSSEAARLIQGALVGARDDAIHSNAPSGIRLLPDPAYFTATATGQIDATQILACNRIIPIEPAPEYTEGMASVDLVNPRTFTATSTLVPKPLAYWFFNGTTWVSAGNYPGTALMIEESAYVPGANGQPNPPANWWWNVRIGDKVQISNAGPWYTVIGPMAIPPGGITLGGSQYANPELFVNVSPPGVGSPTQRFRSGTSVGFSPLVRQFPTPNGPITYQPEFLFLVNGQDDNANGWVDEGWDGVDNNGDTQTDEPAEWIEVETWRGSIGGTGVRNQPYTIRRRPVPVPGSREIALPSGVVIDLTSWGNPAVERSRLPSGAFNPFTGYVDILINPDGTVVSTTLYSSPSSVGLSGAFYHLWLAERGDLWPIPPGATTAPVLPFPKGEYRIVTLFSRTGAVTATENPSFDDPAKPANGVAYNPSLPYIPAQQGVVSR